MRAFVGLLVLLIAGCAVQPSVSPSVAPSETAQPSAASTPAAMAAFTYTRDYVLERTLPDEIDGRPLVKWSLNSFALDQLRRSGAIDSFFGDAYASAQYWNPGVAGPGQIVVEAVWYTGLHDEDLANAFETHWKAESCQRHPIASHFVDTCMRPGYMAADFVTFYVRGHEIWITDYPSVLATLPQ